MAQLHRLCRQNSYELSLSVRGLQVINFLQSF